VTKAVKKTKSPAKQSKNPLLALEASNVLGCSMALIYQMRRDGRLKSGFVKGKHLYFSTDEIQKLKDSGEIHPRKRQQKLGVGDLVSSHQEAVQFEVDCPSAQYNMLSMMLAPQKLSVSQWCAQMVQATVAQAQQSMTGTITAAGNQKK
jgi:hypothetical protein